MTSIEYLSVAAVSKVIAVKIWAKHTAILGLWLSAPSAVTVTAFMASNPALSSSTTITVGMLISVLGVMFAFVAIASASAVAYLRLFVGREVRSGVIIEVRALHNEIKALRTDMVTREILELHFAAHDHKED